VKHKKLLFRELDLKIDRMREIVPFIAKEKRHENCAGIDLSSERKC
jgi:hypothetical protein